MVTHYRPDIGTEHDQGKLPACEVLLIPEVLIGCNHHAKSCRLSSLKKRAVFELGMPLHFDERAHFMPGQGAARRRERFYLY